MERVFDDVLEQLLRKFQELLSSSSLQIWMPLWLSGLLLCYRRPPKQDPGLCEVVERMANRLTLYGQIPID
jgi:hypothetical protein